MGNGPQLTDMQRKKIIADYAINTNYSETARMNGVHLETVRRVIKKYPQARELANQKQEENTQDMLSYMESTKGKRMKLLDKIIAAMDGKLDNIDMFTNIKDLATAYGIIFDKDIKALEISRERQSGMEPIRIIFERSEQVADDSNKRPIDT